MAVERKDRVRDQTSTTGTGTITLAGSAPTGYRTLASAHTDGATVRYAIFSADQSEWEVGQGVWTASGSTLTRATVYASSNANALVNFSAGTKTVFTGPVAADIGTLAGTTNQVTVTNGDTGSPTISLPATIVLPAGLAASVDAGAAATTTSAGNTLSLKAGAGGSTSGAGGAVTVQGGTPVAGAGGDATLRASDGVGTNQNGGVAIVAAGSATGSGTAGYVSLRTGGTVEQARTSHVASAVNYVELKGGATGTDVVVGAQGSDTNIGISLTPKGSGTVKVPTAAVNTNDTTAASTAFVVAQIADDAPTKTGGGASGMWGISISGQAATVATVTASQVGSGMAGLAVGDVGTFGWFQYTPNSSTINPGDNTAGSNLKWAGIYEEAGVVSVREHTNSPSGTWKCMGYTQTGSTTDDGYTLFMRVS